MYWLHHVGKTYWTPAKFRQECKKYGVSRRISIRAIKGMEFGDKILLAMWDGAKSVIFGQFMLDTVYFQKPETLQALGDLQEKTVKHRLVTRGCGMYTVVSETEVKAQLGDIVNAAKDDQLMIGGKWEDVKPKVNLKKVPHRLGFRPFDYALAESEFETKTNKKGEPVLYGQYYTNADNTRVIEALLGVERKMVRIAQYKKK